MSILFLTLTGLGLGLTAGAGAQYVTQKYGKRKVEAALQSPVVSEQLEELRRAQQGPRSMDTPVEVNDQKFLRKVSGESGYGDEAALQREVKQYMKRIKEIERADNERLARLHPPATPRSGPSDIATGMKFTYYILDLTEVMTKKQEPPATPHGQRLKSLRAKEKFTLYPLSEMLLQEYAHENSKGLIVVQATYAGFSVGWQLVGLLGFHWLKNIRVLELRLRKLSSSDSPEAHRRARAWAKFIYGAPDLFFRDVPSSGRVEDLKLPPLHDFRVLNPAMGSRFAERIIEHYSNDTAVTHKARFR